MARPYYLPRGRTGEGSLSLLVTPETAGWTFSGLRVVELEAGDGYTFETGEDEVVVLPLAGGCTVGCGGEKFDLDGREDVFSQVTDFVYLPRDAEAELFSRGGGRFALPAARAGRRLPARYGAAERSGGAARGGRGQQAG